MVERDGSNTAPSDVDVVVVGAGFSGLYLLHRLRTLGFTTRVFDSAGDVGGTWYWNRYPGARCDIPTTDYTFSFDPELERDWTWSEKYATQPEILSYLQFVADRYDLRRDITFSTRVTSAAWDESAARWRVRTDQGEEISCQFYVMASGCLSLPKASEIPGQDRFGGEVYFTSTWPHEGVDFTGKRVAVIGTGSSGIQSIPLIAEQASQLTVFQRTANFSIPARNGPPAAPRLAALAADRVAYRDSARQSRAGVPTEVTEIAGAYATDEVRRARFEAAWEAGELIEILGVFNDLLSNPTSNDVVAEMIREKIRSTVHDPETAEALCPKDHPFGSKRPCLDTNYFQTYNLPHVRLVDLRTRPIVSITESGIETTKGSIEFDAIVYATGFDAMTGPVVAVDIKGRDGLSLREKWADGPSTYLGLTTVGFPNFFTVTGPGSPSVLSNMAVSIEQHVEWIAGCLDDLRAGGFQSIEPTPLAEAGWNQHVDDGASITLYPERELLVHGGERARQTASLLALRGRRRRLPRRLRRGRRPRLPGLLPRRARWVAVPRRSDPSSAGRRGHAHPDHGGPGSTSHGVVVGRGRPGSHAGHGGRAAPRPGSGRGRRWRAPGCRRAAGLPALPAGR